MFQCIMYHIVFTCTVITGKTMLKRWMSLCNPIVTIALSVVIGMISPVWGKYYGTCCPMVGLFLLFLCTSIVLSRNVKMNK